MKKTVILQKNNAGVLYEQKGSTIQKLVNSHMIHPHVASILVSKEITQDEAVHNFLYPLNKNRIHHSSLLRDCDKACSRIISASRNNEKVVIAGDYDVDGMMASIILGFGLKHLLNIPQFVKLPLREEGYGIKASDVELFHANGISLIITVDNGTSAHEALQRARELGIDVIVTDHHEVSSTFPSCFAFVNPKRPDCTYPFKNICGAVVALKIVELLMIKILGKVDGEYHNVLLQYAGIATIADMMPLIDENRTIVSFCIELLKSPVL